MKEAQKGAMRNLPLERKEFLILQHRQSQPRRVEPLHPTSPGPASEEGIFSNVKRFSLATVGWGGNAASDTVPKPAPSRPVTTFGSSGISTSSQPVSPTSTALQGQTTGSSSTWSSWWSTASSMTGTGQAGTEHAKDTPQFYVDQMSSRCASLPNCIVACRTSD